MKESAFQKARRAYELKLPSVFKKISTLSFGGEKTESCLADEKELKAAFPHLFGNPLLHAKEGSKKENIKPLKVGVVLSGGQAAGGHNVIVGIFDALKSLHKDSELFGFLGGPSGIVENKYKKLEKELLDLYRNTGGFDLIGSGRTKIETEEQLEKSLESMKKLHLDGLIIIGGDDSNTNAAVLAEYFLKQGISTKVVGVPKTIDGDLQNEHLEISFGFDTACRTYSEMIGNIEKDALSAKKYFHFIKLMGRSASHIALECALQTHPNFTFISEEVAEKKMTLKEITKHLADLVQKRSESKKEYGVVLVPEGLIEFIPEMKKLIDELNLLLAKEGFSSLAKKELLEKVKGTLKKDLLETFTFLPESIQGQLLLDRDPHGNVQVSHINTESLFIETTAVELKKRGFKGKFSPVAHFFGYEGRAGFPTNFDATYCYGLGYTALCLIKEGYTGYMASMSNLLKPVSNWIVKGIPLVSLMNMEMRKGKPKPVIRKYLVDLKGKAFLEFKKKREGFEMQDEYVSPGPIQFFGDPSLTDRPPETVRYNRGN